MDQQIQQHHNPSGQVVQPTLTGLNVETSQPIQYNQKAAKILGGIQILIGIINLLLNIYVFFSYAAVNILRFMGYGIWGGSLFIVAGLLQVLSGKSAQNVCLIMGTLVMCVISACACAVGFPFGIIEASGRGFFSSSLSKSLASVVAVLAFFEAVISIVSSSMCCRAICRLKPDVPAVPFHGTGNQTVSDQSKNPVVVFPVGPFHEKPSAPQVENHPT